MLMKIGGGTRSSYAKSVFIDCEAKEVNQLLALIVILLPTGALTNQVVHFVSYRMHLLPVTCMLVQCVS